MEDKPLSREFLIKQGSCCNNNCINCPYKKNNMKITKKLCGTLLMTLLTICILGFYSCGTVDKVTTHSCELMENGQKCLPDHSCCK